MPRNAFRLWLKPDPLGIETYAQWHLHPFPGLYDLIRDAGIRRYTIWLDGADLLLTREADDLTKGETLDMSNPIHKEWADTMTPLFDERVRGGPGVPTEVFTLDPDAEAGAAQMTYRTGLQPGPEAVEAMTTAHPERPADVVDAPPPAGPRPPGTGGEGGGARA